MPKPKITGTVQDASGRPATGNLQITAQSARSGTDSGVVIDERTRTLQIVAGAITGSPNLEPGPARISLAVEGAPYRVWSDVVIPDDRVEITLDELLEQVIDYEPGIVSRVFDYMQRALAAAEAAEQGTVADNSVSFAKLAADVRSELESAAKLPPGGTNGQVLAKSGAGLTWTTPSSGGGTGGGGIFLDTDGVPYFDTSGTGGGSIALDVDGVPYVTGV